MSKRNKKHKHKFQQNAIVHQPAPASQIGAQEPVSVVETPVTEVERNHAPQGLNRAQRRQMMQGGVTVHSELYSGPLPHPETLIRFNEAHPGAAGIIIEEFQLQAAHRRRQESKVVTTNVLTTVLGQIFAFIILGGIVAGGVYLATTGRSFEGVGAILISVIAGLRVLDAATKAKQQNIAEKRADARKR